MEWAVLKALPEYCQGRRWDTPGQHYATVDPEPTPVVSAGAIVKLDLSSKSDASLAAFAEAHILAMTDNPNFLNPMPSETVFGLGLSTYEGRLALVDAKRLELKQLVEEKDQARAMVQTMLSQRGSYVQIQSNGSAELIHSAAFETRKAPTKKGELPWPQNLRIESGPVRGTLIPRWMAVRGVRLYVAQMAEVVAGQPLNWNQIYSGGKPTFEAKSLVAGKTYAFRLAAMGGSTGQSEWSPEVRMMA